MHCIPLMPPPPWLPLLHAQAIILAVWVIVLIDLVLLILAIYVSVSLVRARALTAGLKWPLPPLLPFAGPAVVPMPLLLVHLLLPCSPSNVID